MTLKIKVDGKDRCILNVEFVEFKSSNRAHVYVNSELPILFHSLFQWIGRRQGKYSVFDIEIISAGNPIYGYVLHSQHHEFKQECWLYL